MITALIALFGFLVVAIILGTAPAATARQTPSGVMMDDGFPTKIACVNLPAVNFWEVTLTPPGIDGGEKIQTSTMFNRQWHTAAPRVLQMLTDAEGECAFEPKVLSDIQAIINVNQAWTVTFPNGDTWAWWGVLQSFTPGSQEEGKRPTAKFKIYATNHDNTGVEAGPVLVSTGGT